MCVLNIHVVVLPLPMQCAHRIVLHWYRGGIISACSCASVELWRGGKVGVRRAVGDRDLIVSDGSAGRRSVV